MDIDDSIISNTIYSNKQNDSEWHYHENLHISFVFEGGKADTLRNTKYTDPNGSVFFYHSEEKHRWISPQSISKSANIEIGRAFLKKHQLSEAIIKEAITKRPNAKALILKIQNEMLTNDLNSHSSIESLVLELITNPEMKTFKDTPKWVVVLRELLHDNWDKELSLDEIARIVQLHPITISKYFRKYFSCTLGEYKRMLKVEKSIELIKEFDKSLYEIAYDCNFSDQSHFIRNFKKATGFLPKNFRSF
ncbi:AraC family transcriptional regulator [Flagellimonas sp. HMM57]|uniref:AraC family transcriptional regulator n=1 Tax=unclassified Flagellimonas TaxID=2644544 RepID=UPI0013D56EB6|nr:MULTISPECIES: AraC family transcriptional regulator [unclassified Flagellimonas]UII75728.1 AraC family transcriptional regulator [Flagellimonas sp. HMM57]